MGGSKKGGTAGIKQAQFLRRNLANEIKGPRRSLINQFSEALRTGSIGAQNPLIQKSVEASRIAGSQAQSATAESLGQAGITGPQAQRILADQRTSSDLATSRIPAQATQSVLSLAPSFLQGQTGQVAGLSQGLLQANTALLGGQQAQAGQTQQGIGQGLGTLLALLASSSG